MLTTHNNNSNNDNNNNNNNNNNNKPLVLMNGKLQDVIWRPVNTRLRPGPQTPDKTNPRKNGVQRKRGTQKVKKLMSKIVGLLEKKPTKILISNNI